MDLEEFVLEDEGRETDFDGNTYCFEKSGGSLQMAVRWAAENSSIRKLDVKHTTPPFLYQNISGHHRPLGEFVLFGK